MTASQALARLESLCARSEQCSNDLMVKLRSWGIGRDDAGKIMESLMSRRFVDDRRFCMAFVRDKLKFSRWGRTKIRAALSLKHADRNHAEEALESIDSDEYLSVLESMIDGKARTLKDADSYEGRTKLFRFAASRGFEPELISMILRRRTAGD